MMATEIQHDASWSWNFIQNACSNVNWFIFVDKTFFNCFVLFSNNACFHIKISSDFDSNKNVFYRKLCRSRYFYSDNQRLADLFLRLMVNTSLDNVYADFFNEPKTKHFDWIWGWLWDFGVLKAFWFQSTNALKLITIKTNVLQFICGMFEILYDCLIINSNEDNKRNVFTCDHVSLAPNHPTKEFYFSFHPPQKQQPSIEHKQQLQFLISFSTISAFDIFCHSANYFSFDASSSIIYNFSRKSVALHTSSAKHEKISAKKILLG